MPQFIKNTAYLPVGSTLRYQRGDGAIITMTASSAAAATASPAPITQPRSDYWPAVYDHPLIGGPVTLLVYLTGGQEHESAHRFCLDSLVSSIPRSLYQLRVGSCALSRGSLKYVEALHDRGIIHTHYRHLDADNRLHVMIEMLRDTQRPITTKWTLWFDQPLVARVPNWFERLCRTIVDYYPSGYDMYGAKYVRQVPNGFRTWAEQKIWFQGRPFRDAQGFPLPDGDRTIYVKGGFWAANTESLHKSAIPEWNPPPGLADVVIGEQLWQTGYSIKNWNADNEFLVHPYAHHGR